jgi:hypothetical protein
MPEPERFITADEALFETERAVAGLAGEGGMIGKMEQPEALKLAEALFGGDMPDDIREFFTNPPGKDRRGDE